MSLPPARQSSWSSRPQQSETRLSTAGAQVHLGLNPGDVGPLLPVAAAPHCPALRSPTPMSAPQPLGPPPPPISPYPPAPTVSLGFRYPSGLGSAGGPSLCLSPRLPGGPLCASAPLPHCLGASVSQGSCVLTPPWLHCLFTVSSLGLPPPQGPGSPSLSQVAGRPSFHCGLWGQRTVPAENCSRPGRLSSTTPGREPGFGGGESAPAT